MTHEARPPKSRLRERLVRMTAAWLVLGIVIGAQAGFRLGGDVVSTASHVLAGALVFVPLGLVLGVFADRAKESMIGGVVGLLVGVAAGPRLDPAQPGEFANLCLVTGALAGATCWPWVRAAHRMILWAQRKNPPDSAPVS